MPSLFKPKTGTMWGWPIAGLLACDLYLVLESTFFWHQSDQVYLILAKKNLTKHRRKKKKRNKKLNTRTWHMARLSNTWLALSCLLACVVAHSSRHESATVCTLLLCAGPIEGCSAVLAARRYYGFWGLVCASWCPEEEKQVQKQKLRCFIVPYLLLLFRRKIKQ